MYSRFYRLSKDEKENFKENMKEITEKVAKIVISYNKLKDEILHEKDVENILLIEQLLDKKLDIEMVLK